MEKGNGDVRRIGTLIIPFLLALMVYEFIAQYYQMLDLTGQVVAICVVGAFAWFMVRRRHKT
jgi:hypothetical protein